ncbi:hypothetical protein bcgnr5378_64210 [Bacillus cereus]|uniref:hypothetical protein n=1 Tax=Bacillus TaxID=1386 RepID=UPI001BB3AF76|nr:MULTISPECIES: hypothetical protein [Bacillus]BCC09593.1 hypothetical protein BCM0060_p332 [Bacillus cereus]BCC50612.1 hypothetical protein BCJMU02_p309 [Bacillus cereus]
MTMKEEIKNFYLAAGRVIKKYTEVESTFTKTSVYGNLVDNSRNGEMLKRELKELFQFKFLNKISMEDEKFRESLYTVTITEPFKLTTKEYKLYSDHFMLGLLGK